MKIVYLINSLENPGGMERVLVNKANYFSKHFGYKIIIITTEQQNKKIYFNLNKEIELIDLGIDYSEDYLKPIYRRILPFIKKQKLHRSLLGKKINELKADYVVSLGCEDFRFLDKINDKSKKIREMHFGKDYRKILVKAFNKGFIYSLKANIDTFLEEKKSKKLYKLIVLTNEDKEKWKYKKNIEVIYNSILPMREKVSNLENKIAISVGRLDGQKGYDLLIESWNSVSKKYPDWKLNIFGDGIDKEKLKQQIRKLNLENKIFLKGTTKKIEEKYLESSFYIMSSRYEGFGMVLVEAMSYGLPLISFECPSGPRDIIDDGINGYLVEDGNTEVLAKIIVKVLSDKEKLVQMGKNAKKSCERFSEEKIMNEWRKLFEDGIKK